MNGAFRGDRRRARRCSSRRPRVGNGAPDCLDGAWPKGLDSGRAVVLLLSGGTLAEGPVWGLWPDPDRLAMPAHLPGLLPRGGVPAHGEPAVCARVLRRADIELDPVLHIARRAGRALELSAKEFAVLQALMGTRDVLSAEDLLEQAWDQHADPFTNTVKVTISRLRKKLGGPQVIENIPRVGYRLSDTPAGSAEP